MISISKLYLGNIESSDALRYGARPKGARTDYTAVSADKGPVVVWNVTRRCNLNCIHCYSQSGNRPAEHELTTSEGRRLIDDLARFHVPVLLFSGGEPLLRDDLIDLARHAASSGIRAVISTNGTLIDDVFAEKLNKSGVAYAGISLDGLRGTHDCFRCKDGAFDMALAGIRACRRDGLKVGVRYTITKRNMSDISGIFDLLEAEEIPRVCFYHLVNTGRGADIKELNLSGDETRRVVDLIIGRTLDMHKRGIRKEVLTVDNHCDGPYLYLRMARENSPRAEEVMDLLRRNGGNSSGEGIGCVSWDGTVYPDQFWRTHAIGNVRERSFSEIWTDPSSPLLSELREKGKHVKGRCAKCRFLDVCAGNFRARAEAETGDVWGCDPACYLTDEESFKLVRRSYGLQGRRRKDSRLRHARRVTTACQGRQTTPLRHPSADGSYAGQAACPAKPAAARRSREGGKKGKQTIPRVIAWEVTRRCVLKCRHCRGAARDENYEGELSTPECKLLIDDLSRFTASTINHSWRVASHQPLVARGEPSAILILTGGEPMTRPDIYDIARYAADAGLRVVMAPCGHLITTETALRIKEAGIKAISVSIDGSTAEKHDEFRGVSGAYEKTIEGLKHAAGAGIPFQINTTVTKLNMADLPAIYELAIDLGAKAFDVFFLVPTGRGAGLRDLEISADEHERILRWIAQTAKSSPIPIKTTCAPHYARILKQEGGQGQAAGGCMAGREFVFISHLGILQPCGFFDRPCGDLRKEKYDFKKLYETSDVFNDLRCPDKYHGKCGVCEFRCVCGGCRARALAHTGDYMDEEPACAYVPGVGWVLKPGQRGE